MRNPGIGRDYYDRRKAEGKTSMEAMRCLKRRLSDIVYRELLDDAIARRLTTTGTGPGGQRGDDSDSSAAGSQPHTDSSDKPHPNPPSTHPRTHSPLRLDTEGSHERAMAATLHSMSDMWSAEHLLQVVRARIGSGPDEARTPMRAVLEGTDILVTFYWGDDPQLYGVRFATTDAPEGASTGEVCGTAKEWAQEVALVLMEELDTGLVARGRRSSSVQGLVELHYRPDR